MPVALWIATVALGSDIALSLVSLLILSTANSISVALALSVLKSRRAPAGLYTGPLLILVLGGIVQALIIAHSTANSGSFLDDFMPEQTWITSEQAAAGLVRVSVGLIAFCVAVAFFGTILIFRKGTSDRANDVSETRIIWWFTFGIVVFLVLSLVQYSLGFGQGALYSRSRLPFRFDSAILFLRTDLAPLLLLLMLWIGDRRSSRMVRLAYLGFVCVVASDTIIATSRGAIFSVGIPIFFLWLITGRLTARRKAILAASFVVYLVAAPIVTDLRISRVSTATGSTSSLSINAEEIADRTEKQVSHFVVRVQGAGSTIWALEDEGTISPASLYTVFRPSGMTEYFTFEVVGLPRSDVVKQGRAPTVIGLGTMAGGLEGTILVVSLVVLLAAIAQNLVMSRASAWPVGAAVVASAFVTFFSEGVPMNLYKSAIAFVLVERFYRYLSRPQPHIGAS